MSHEKLAPGRHAMVDTVSQEVAARAEAHAQVPLDVVGLGDLGTDPRAGRVAV